MRLISTKCPPGNKLDVTLENNNYICYCWTTTDGISATAVTDKEYPERGAFTLLYNVIMEFRDWAQPQGILDNVTADMKVNWPALERFLRDWQDPTQADKLMKVEKQLFDVTEIMKKNLQDLMDRGESIDQLMDKSKDLNQQSVQFYRSAKKTNSKCCNTSWIGKTKKAWSLFWLGKDWLNFWKLDFFVKKECFEKSERPIISDIIKFFQYSQILTVFELNWKIYKVSQI